MRIFALAGLVLGLSAMAAAQTTAPWDYAGKRGPLEWGKLDPAYKVCSQGHEQSPIDIRGAHLNKALQPIEFHYISAPVTLENNGHTVLVHVHPGSYIVAGRRALRPAASSTSTTPAEESRQGQALRHGRPPGAQERRRQRRRWSPSG
jgi:carbonic anhydrase